MIFNNERVHENICLRVMSDHKLCWKQKCPNALFIASNALKCIYFVDYKTIKIRYKVNNNLLPDCIHRLKRQRGIMN